jgi:hypothetical protein
LLAANGVASFTVDEHVTSNGPADLGLKATIESVQGLGRAAKRSQAG